MSNDDRETTSYYFGHTPVMARELVAKALESGQYTQTRGQLSKLTPAGTGSGYNLSAGVGDCCLGVACKVFVQEEPEQAKSLSVKTSEDGASVIYGLSKTHLPPIVAAWLDLSEDGERQYIADNDVNQLDFPTIAGNFRAAVMLGRTQHEKAGQQSA